MKGARERAVTRPRIDQIQVKTRVVEGRPEPQALGLPRRDDGPVVGERREFGLQQDEVARGNGLGAHDPEMDTVDLGVRQHRAQAQGQDRRLAVAHDGDARDARVGRPGKLHASLATPVKLEMEARRHPRRPHVGIGGEITFRVEGLIGGDFESRV